MKLKAAETAECGVWINLVIRIHNMIGGTISLIIPNLENMEEGLVSPH